MQLVVWLKALLLRHSCNLPVRQLKQGQGQIGGLKLLRFIGECNTIIKSYWWCNNKVALFRSSFGAVENRIDASINNLTTLKINTEAAKSRIEDADFAAETSNLTKSQILSQAATSMLAQANASKQNLLALLQG